MRMEVISLSRSWSIVVVVVVLWLLGWVCLLDDKGPLRQAGKSGRKPSDR